MQNGYQIYFLDMCNYVMLAIVTFHEESPFLLSSISSSPLPKLSFFILSSSLVPNHLLCPSATSPARLPNEPPPPSPMGPPCTPQYVLHLPIIVHKKRYLYLQLTSYLKFCFLSPPFLLSLRCPFCGLRVNFMITY